MKREAAEALLAGERQRAEEIRARGEEVFARLADPCITEAEAASLEAELEALMREMRERAAMLNALSAAAASRSGGDA